MNPLGTTRSSVTRDHALIAPDSHVPVAMPGWNNAKIVTLISPRMGAHFQQYLALMDSEGTTALGEHPTLERFVYVLEGSVIMQLRHGKQVTMTPGQPFYEGPEYDHLVARNASITEPAKFLVVLIKNKGAPALLPVE